MMSTLAMPQPALMPIKRREESAVSDFVEQKLFTSEVKRIDSEVSHIKKAEEKQDKTVFEAVNRLHNDMDKKFEAVDKRFERLESEINRKFESVDKRFERLEGEIHSNFRWLIGMYITGLVGTLAAFYAFASYIKG